MALGVLLDAVGNSITLIPPGVTYAGTAAAVLLMVAARIYLRRSGIDWVSREKRVRIRGFSVGVIAWVAGMILLLWVPRFIGLARPAVVRAPAYSNVNPTAVAKRPLAKPSLRLTVSRPSLRIGETCQITWEAQNATSVVILPEPGVVASSGSHLVNPQHSMEYLVAAVDDVGAADVRTVRLQVVDAPAVNQPIELPTGSIVASPDSMVDGEPPQIKWSTYNATTVAIFPVIGFVGGAGEMAVFPKQTTTFHMFIANGYSTASASVQVQVYRWPGSTSSSWPRPPNS